MARFISVSEDQSSGATAEVYAIITKALGKVPNAYATLATLAPEALQSHAAGRQGFGDRAFEQT